jgi:multicomponent Na+:H+ antiporter subunit D
VAVALAVSLMTLYSMTKVWNEAFWKDPELAQKSPSGIISAGMWVPTAALVINSLLVGIFSEPILQFSQQAAIQLMNPAIYISAVLGGLP